MNQHTLIVGSHPSHAPRIVGAWHSAGEAKPVILALDVELEQILSAKDVTFLSQERFREKESLERFTCIETWVAATLSSAPLRSYTYRNIPFLKAYAYGLQFFLLQVAYYGSLLNRALAALPQVHTLYVCAEQAHERPDQIVLTRDPLGALLRVARAVAGKRGVTLHLLEEHADRRHKVRTKRTLFLFMRSLFGFGIAMLNLCTGLLPRRSIRVLASEKWSNVEPLLSAFPESELVLLDRAEVRHMGIAAAFHHRTRFVHIDEYVDGGTKVRARNAAQDIAERWAEERGKLVGPTYDDLPMGPFMEEALDTLFLHGVPRITREIEASRIMLRKHRPHLVLLRASVSNQTHFATLALVARSLGIPAIELQHGLEYLGPGSISRAHTAEYIATYGPLVARELQAIGYAPEKTLIVGSPRFDSYCAPAHTVEHQFFTVLVLAPEMVTIFFDTYEVAEYYRTAAAAVRAIHGATAIIKIRPIPERELFHRQTIEEAFKGLSYTIVQYESVAECLSRSDAMITCYSTVVLEAILSKVPVVLVAMALGERLSIDGHFTSYADAGALRIAHSPEELARHLEDLVDPSARAESTIAAQAFLREHYAFDGRGTVRLLERMRKAAGKAPAPH